MKEYTHIIWDWNGTLYDDVAWCVSRINIMLAKRGLPMLRSVDEYRRVFGFPVIDYYRRVGFDFDKEPFEILAAEFIELYHAENTVPLFPNAKEILAGFRRRGIRQIILSASEIGNLTAQIEPFGIADYFDEILGISNVFAASKAELGKSYTERARPARAVLIGDTLHDQEVADALGVDCIIVANGHQSKESLVECGAVTVDCLSDITKILL